MRKKLLFVINTLGCGGTEAALLNLLARPEIAACDCSLYVMLGQGELVRRLPSYVKLLNRDYCSADVLSAEGRRTAARRAMRMVQRRGAALRTLPYLTANGLRMLRGGVQPDKLLWRTVAESAPPQREEYDLAVAYLEGGATYYVSRSVRAKRKVAFVHVDYRLAGYTRALDRGCYDAFDRIFCVSDEVRGAFLSVYPEHAGKTGVFRNFIDRERILSMAGQGTGFPDDGWDGPRILTVGRLVPQKAVEISVEAMRILKARIVRARWYVLGEGEERPALTRRIAAAGLREDFLLPGVVENPYPWFAQADLYIHCSRFEGCSIAIQEAQTLGKCVIVSDCSGNRAQVRDGEDGILVPLTPEAIADAAQRALADDALRARLGAAAAQRRFAPENIDQLFCSEE